MISDSEIPLAVLISSIEKHCNPKFDFSIFLKSTTQNSASSDVVFIEDTQDASSITDKRNIQNKKQHVIIPETCDTQKDTSSITDKRNIQNKKQHIIIPETCDTEKNTDSITTHFSKKSEKKDIAEVKKNEINIVNNISSNKNCKQLQIPETCDPFDKSVTSDNSFEQNSKKPQIIPETSEENSASNLNVNEQQQGKDIFRENIEFQQVEIREEKVEILITYDSVFEENDSIGKKETSERNELVFKKDNTISEKDNLVPDEINSITEDNIASEKDSVGQNDKDRNSKSLRGPRIISIESISIEKIDDNDNREVHVEQIKGNTSKRDYSKVGEQQDTQLKKRKLNVLPNSEENRQEDKTTEEVEVIKRDKKVKKTVQRMVIN